MRGWDKIYDKKLGNNGNVVPEFLLLENATCMLRADWIRQVYLWEHIGEIAFPVNSYILKMLTFFWSEMGALNSRHPAPKPPALPTAPHPEMNMKFCFEVANLWYEPLLQGFCSKGKTVFA